MADGRQPVWDQFGFRGWASDADKRLQQPRNRPELTGNFLATTFLRDPLSALEVVTGIHQDALRLWLKRTPFVHHTEPPENPVSIILDPRIVSHVTVRAD